MTPNGWKQLAGSLAAILPRSTRPVSNPLMRFRQRLLKEVRVRHIRKEDVTELFNSVLAAISGANDDADARAVIYSGPTQRFRS